MSIPCPPVRASSESASLTTFDLRRLLQSLVQPAIPLRLSPQVSPSGWAGGDSPILIGFSFHQPFRQPTPDKFQASESIRRLNSLAACHVFQTETYTLSSFPIQPSAAKAVKLSRPPNQTAKPLRSLVLHSVATAVKPSQPLHRTASLSSPIQPSVAIAVKLLRLLR